MFRLIDPSVNRFRLASVTNILDNVSIRDFINRTASSSEIVLCPTNAIDITKKQIIQDRCIHCGICWIKGPSCIKFDGIYNKNSFLDYCKKEKTFVYTWLSLLLSDYSGTNIKSVGFSRTKRIPLMIITNDKIVYIVKASRTSKDVEMAYNELEDIIMLSKNNLDSFKIRKLIPVIDLNLEDVQFFSRFPDCIFVSIKKMIHNLLTNNYRSITEHIEFSRC